MRRRSEAPYWLEGIEEVCEDCGQRYAWAVEVRCFDCDKPLCPLCVLSVVTDDVCSDCEGARRKH